MDYVDNMEDAEYSSLIFLWKFEQHVLYVLYCQNVNQMDDSNIVQSLCQMERVNSFTSPRLLRKRNGRQLYAWLKRPMHLEDKGEKTSYPITNWDLKMHFGKWHNEDEKRKSKEKRIRRDNWIGDVNLLDWAGSNRGHSRQRKQIWQDGALK